MGVARVIEFLQLAKTLTAARFTAAAAGEVDTGNAENFGVLSTSRLIQLGLILCF